MVFSTYLFLFWFLPIAMGGYALLPQRYRNRWLALSSYVFYGWSVPAYCALLLGATAFNHYCGLKIHGAGSQRARRWFLILSVAGNLLTLAFFKYAGMFSVWADRMLGLFYAGAAERPVVPLLSIALPVGISFFLFQAISYTVDIYRRQCAPARSVVDFAAYLAMFPQLIAGPIVRYQSIADELAHRRHSAGKVLLGSQLFLLGLAKKVLLADSFGMLVPLAFGEQTPSFAAAWVGLGAYSLQIYFDFSGYSDMAVGLGLWLGFHFPKNFDSPYQSRSITEFWRRWHISLSTFLRDYLYIPLGGNRSGPVRTYGNLMLVMLLGGLWHGASVLFLVWGSYHGVLLVIERRCGRWRQRWLPGPLALLITNLLVVLSWVPFRARDPEQMLSVLGALFSPWASVPDVLVPGVRAADGLAPAWLPHGLPPDAALLPWLVPLGFAFCWWIPDSWRVVATFRTRRLWWLSAMTVLLWIVVLAQRESPFLYFRF